MNDVSPKPRAECPSDGDHGQDDNACFCLTLTTMGRFAALMSMVTPEEAS